MLTNVLTVPTHVRIIQFAPIKFLDFSAWEMRPLCAQVTNASSAKTSAMEIHAFSRTLMTAMLTNVRQDQIVWTLLAEFYVNLSQDTIVSGIVTIMVHVKANGASFWTLTSVLMLLMDVLPIRFAQIRRDRLPATQILDINARASSALRRNHTPLLVKETLANL